MGIVNLTPHPIRILDEEGGVQRKIEPSGKVARLATERGQEMDIDGLAISTVQYGVANDMPAPEPGTWYLVSLVTALTLAGTRGDLLVIDQEVRNEEGTIIGCRGLARPTT